MTITRRSFLLASAAALTASTVGAADEFYEFTPSAYPPISNAKDLVDLVGAISRKIPRGGAAYAEIPEGTIAMIGYESEDGSKLEQFKVTVANGTFDFPVPNGSANRPGGKLRFSGQSIMIETNGRAYVDKGCEGRVNAFIGEDDLLLETTNDALAKGNILGVGEYARVNRDFGTAVAKLAEFYR